jgi:hypothetical protein
MKRFLKLCTALVFAAFLSCGVTAAHADGLDLAYKNTKLLPTYPGPGAGDLTVIYDASDDKWKTTPAAVAYASDLTAVNTLPATSCGGTYFLNSATEFATTLPAPVAGCKLTFIVKAAPSGASYTLLTASSANIFIGNVTSADLNAANDGDSSTADDTITITDGVAAVGDLVYMVSDGTSWYYTGVSKTYNAIIATQAS